MTSISMISRAVEGNDMLWRELSDTHWVSVSLKPETDYLGWI